MTINDFIIMTLNISADHVESFNPRKVDGVIYLDITLKPTHPECPYCGGNVVSKGFSEHRYNHLSYGGFPTVIVWKRRRYKCKDCGKSFSEENPFGPENFHQTYALLDDIAKALHSVNATYKDIGERYGVSPTLIQLYMDSFVQAPRMRLPENLGIDEIYSKTLSKYGGSYLCVLVDNNGRQLNDILPNRSKNELSKYFEKIPQAERDNVKYVTIDMWDTYKNVCNKYLRNAEIAVDPFHVIEHLTKGFSRIRIDIMNQAAKNTPTYYLLKSWHRLLETDKIPLDNEPQYNGFFHQKMNRRELYEMTLNLNPDLKEAYELKEMYRDFNKKCSFEEAPAKLDLLIEAFEKANLYCYEEFVGILHEWRQEIINSFRRPYENRKQSNALTESMNQKLRTLLAVSNGYQNFERFRARALYCLNDKLFYGLTSSLTSSKRKGRKRGQYKKHDKPLVNEDIIVDEGNEIDDKENNS